MLEPTYTGKNTVERWAWLYFEFRSEKVKSSEILNQGKSGPGDRFDLDHFNWKPFSENMSTILIRFYVPWPSIVSDFTVIGRTRIKNQSQTCFKDSSSIIIVSLVVSLSSDGIFLIWSSDWSVLFLGLIVNALTKTAKKIRPTMIAGILYSLWIFSKYK